MSAEVVLFVLAICAACVCVGFLLGRYYVPDNRALKRKEKHADAYIKAMNLLLAEDVDGATDALRELVLKDNVSDIQVYFALGALFRSRGEWERAIRVHQAIALRDKKKKLQIEYELGLDYWFAGMPRRATRAMEAVRERRSKHEGALHSLFRLYKVQGRYVEAAETARKLARLRGEDPPDELHFLLVAAAWRAICADDFDSAKNLLKDANGIRESVYAMWVAAELAMRRRSGNARKATDQLKEAMIREPDRVRFLLPSLLKAQHEIAAAAAAKQAAKTDAPVDDDAVREQSYRGAADVLGDAIAQISGDAGGHLALALAELRSHFDPETALDDFRAAADQFPGLLPARVAAARLALASGEPDEIQTELRALATEDGALDWSVKGSWRCGHCGKRDDDFFWQCRSCKDWDGARLDVGRAAQDMPVVVRAPRPAMSAGGVDLALTAAEARALPEPSLDSGLTDEELRLAERRPSMLGRVSGWFSGIWRGRGKSQAQLPPAGE